MAKKKKRNWLEERDQVTSRADRLLNQKGSYEERVNDLSAIRDESVQSMVADRARTSTGDISKVRQDSELNNKRFSDLHSSYITSKIGKTFNGTKIPQTALKDFKSAAAFLQSKGISTDDLLSLNDFTKQRKSNVELKTLADRASGLNIKDTQDLVRKSYNDLDAIKDLANTRKDAEGLLKDIEKYKKNYGNTPEVRVLEERAKGITNYINENAKGGSAVSDVADEFITAPTIQAAEKAKTRGAVLNEMNMREKYGDLNYDIIKGVEGQTPAEKEWLKERRWQLGTKDELKQDYADANEEIYNLQQERESLDEPNAKQKEISQKYGSNTGLSPKGQQLYKAEEEAKEQRKKEIDKRLGELSEFSNRYRKEIEIPEEMAYFNSKELPGLPNKVDSKEIADIIATKSKYDDDQREYLKGMLLERDDALDTYNYIESKLNDYKNKTYEINDESKDTDRDTYTRYRDLQLELASKVAPDLVDEIANDVYENADTDIKDKYKDALSKFGTKLGNDIFEAAKRSGEEQLADFEEGRGVEFGEEHPIISIPTGAVARNTGGLGAFFENIGRLWEFNTDESKLDPVDYNSLSFRRLKYGQGQQEGGLQAIDNDALQKVYQAINSGADMGLATAEAAPLFLIPGVGQKLGVDAITFIMGTQAGASSMLEAHEQGMSDREALQYGLVSGLNETAGEKFSVETILNSMGGKAKGLKALVSGLGKAFLAEGSEEVVTDLLNQTYDNMVNKEDSLYNRKIKEYMKQGLTKKAATEKVDNEFLGQLGDEFTVGGLAGLMFGGGVGAVNTVANQITDAKTTRDVGKIINDSLDTGELTDEDLDYMAEVGMKSSVPEINEKAEKLKSKIDNGQSVSNMEIGSLSRDLIAANEGIDLEDTDIQTNEITSQIAEKGAEYNLPKKAIQSMVDNYDGNISPAKYATGFSELYTMGQDTQIDSLQDAIKVVPSLRNTINEIGTQAAGVAFSEGNNPRVEDIVLPQTKPKGRVVTDFEETPEDQLYTDTLKRQAKLTGLDIVVTDDIAKYTNQKNAQGAAFISGGKVVLDKATANILGTADHEILGHFGKALAPKAYKELANIVGSIYREDLGIRGYDDFVKQLEKEHGVSNTDAQEEAIAYGLETLMMNPEVAKKSIMKIYDSSMTDAEKKTIVSKLLEFVKHIIDNLKERVKNANVRTGTESMLDEDLDATKIAEAKLKVYEEIRSNLESMTESKGEVSEKGKYSFAGTNSKTANLVKLDEAKKMFTELSKDKSLSKWEVNQEVLDETGWFKGLDGKWKYEIDENGYKLNTDKISTDNMKLSDIIKHDDLFKAYPELKDISIKIAPRNDRAYGSYSKSSNSIYLNDRFFVDSKANKRRSEILNSKEYKEYSKELHKIADENKDEISSALKKWTNLMSNSDVKDKVVIKELGEAEKTYKALKKERSDKLDKQYKKWENSKLGKELSNLDLRKNLDSLDKSEEEEIKKTLIHEIQHAIQEKEGFAEGASPGYWAQIVLYDKYTQLDTVEHTRLEDNIFAIKDKITDEVGLGIGIPYFSDLDEVVRYENMYEYALENGEDDRLEFIQEQFNEAKKHVPKNIFDKYYEPLKAARKELNEFERQIRVRNSRSAVDLYTETAGEIEARDVEKRLKYSSNNDYSSRILPDSAYGGEQDTDKVVYSGLNSDNAKYSLTPEQKQLSNDYDQAVEDNDTDKAAKLVEQYAKSKGYDTKVYHGTFDFGFTKIDTNASDDKTSFFATPDLKLAQTYSATMETPYIARGERDISKLTTKQLIRTLKDVSNGEDGRVDIYEAHNVKPRLDFIKELYDSTEHAFNLLYNLADEENVDKYKQEFDYFASDFKTWLKDQEEGDGELTNYLLDSTVNSLMEEVDKMKDVPTANRSSALYLLREVKDIASALFGM